ncbi:glycosyltransferase family 2 protein [Acidisoma cladoniae]|jgi:GT2 family glycosyltransferase|uniref:glycosyltransferase family 2 protein n=1 Tax=Acidisoma cladoniae TaxID=3040935 RepID=UPI00254BD839|nr:glycosyltransferase family 2 protein [Acidisoma sp. PAMC 29798]
MTSAPSDDEAIGRLQAELEVVSATLAATAIQRDQLLASTSWRITAPLRRFWDSIRAGRRRVTGHGAEREPEPAPEPPPPPPPETEYERWMRLCDRLSEDDRSAIQTHIGAMAQPPLIAIVMRVHETPGQWVRDAITSVRTQLYPHWELCVIGAASHPILAEVAAVEPRIKLSSQHSDGAFVAFMGSQDLLSERALYEVAAELECHPDTDLIYVDEDEVDEKGVRTNPYFKPDWNIDLMLGQNLVGAFIVCRRALMESIGVCLGDPDPPYALALKIAAATTPDRLRHIPSVLYHARRTDAAPPSTVAMQSPIQASMRSQGAEVALVPVGPHWMRTRWPLPDPAPRVSLIVPSRDHAELLARCASGLLHRTDYANLELLIVDHENREPEALRLIDRLRHDRRVRVLPYQGEFNYAAINNAAVREATGEILVLINNDIDVIDGDWLREMVSHAVRPDVGAVGAKLLYADDTVQHAGVVLGVAVSRVAGHFGHGAARDDAGPFGQFALTRELSAVTGACLALRRAVYEQVGGMDAEHLPVSFNDVDLCLRIRAAGLRVVWTPFAELYHLESASRGGEQTPAQLDRAKREIATMRDRWGAVLDHDPFHNPNFDRADPNVLTTDIRMPRRWADVVTLPRAAAD